MKRRAVGPSVSFFAFQDIITAVVGIFILITLILVLELTQRVEAATSKPAADVEQIQATIESLESEVDRLEEQLKEQLDAQASIADLNAFSREEKVAELKAAINALEQQIDSTESETKELQEQQENESQREEELKAKSKELESEREEIEKLKKQIAELAAKQNELASDDGLVYRDKTAEGRFVCLIVADEEGIVVRDAQSKSVLEFKGAERVIQLQDWLQQQNNAKRHFLLMVRPGGAADFEDLHGTLQRRGAVFGFDVVAPDNEVRLGFEVDDESYNVEAEE